MTLSIVRHLLPLPIAGLLCAYATAAAAQDAPPIDAAPPGADAAVAAQEEAGAPGPPTVDPRVLGPMPTLQAVTGLYHLTSAQTSTPLTFRLGVFGQYFNGSDVVRANDEDNRFVGTLGLSVTPLPWLEPYLVLSARSNYNTFSSPQTVLAQGDTFLGTKGVYPVAPAFHVGGELRLIFLNGAGDTSFDFSATGARLALLGTFDGGELPSPIPLRAHANLGYLVDNSDQLLPEDSEGRKLPPDRVERFAQGLSAYDQVLIGLGVEVPLPWVSLHAEYNLGLLAGQEPAALCGPEQPLPCPAEAGFGGNPQTLTLGVKGQPIEGLILNGGLDIGLATKDVSGVPITAPYNLIFGLAYVFDPRPRIVEVEKLVEKPVVVEARPKVGAVDGRIVDADTGEPIAGAVVSYADTSLTRQSSGTDGAFRSYDFEVDKTVRVQVEHPEYEARTVEATMQEGDNALAIKLNPLGKKGVVAGVIRAGGAAASGTVILTGPKTYRINLEEGRFGQKVLVGRYTVAVTVSGYLTAGRDVELAEGGEASLELDLVPRPEVSVVTVTENRLLVDGRIEFEGGSNLKPEAAARLDQVVAALFEHPEFSRVRIEGHTDEGGNEKKRLEVSQAQADAVMRYLVGKGVSADRLEARGFGDSQPLVPAISPRNREINRRIAFTIVSRRNADAK